MKSSPEPKGATKWPWRIPPAVAGIQVNHCKNPLCRNFGIPPKETAGPRGKAGTATIAEPGDYRIVATGKDRPAIKCKLCGEIVPFQSNLAIVEELMRITAYLEPTMPSCKNEDCANFGDTSESLYVRNGVNAHGTPRFRCAGCKKTFADGGRATRRQRQTHLNRDIFNHLVNSVAIRRIIKLLQISPTTLYSRIGFIHRQCLLFASEREIGLMKKKDLGVRYVSVDRQKIYVNWSSRRDRRNTPLLSMASVDQTTGYVFAVNVNYDPSLDPDTVEKDSIRFGDHHLAHPFRRYARVWLPRDFERAARTATARRAAAAQASAAKPPATSTAPLTGLSASIAAAYAAAAEREDVEAGYEPSTNARTPAKGMLLHEQVVMNAHVQFVVRLLQNAPKLRFYLDQESGLRAAFMAAVPRRILNRTADTFYVEIEKENTIDEKRKLVSVSRKRLAAFRAANPKIDEYDVKIMLVREEMARVSKFGEWEDRWLDHPSPDMREPEKKVCWLTEIDEPETLPARREQQLNYFASLYLRASATAVDRFFMQVRRALTMAERSVGSASSDARVWYGKSSYDPNNLTRLLEIFRTYFNYCEVGEDKKTPAMRLGLAKGPVALEDILYFVPKQPERRRAARSTHATAHEKGPSSLEREEAFE